MTSGSEDGLLCEALMVGSNRMSTGKSNKWQVRARHPNALRQERRLGKMALCSFPAYHNFRPKCRGSITASNRRDWADPTSLLWRPGDCWPEQNTVESVQNVNYQGSSERIVAPRLFRGCHGPTSTSTTVTCHYTTVSSLKK